MTEFNPLAGAILSSTVVQKQSGDAKQQQIRRSQLVRSNSGLPTDVFEPHVESSDELHATDDRQKKGSGQRDPRRPKKPNPTPHQEVAHDHIDLCG
jgi:hypothetical protein